nr:MAG TPA: hypothetical protein [Caudoviricetes sp.]
MKSLYFYNSNAEKPNKHADCEQTRYRFISEVSKSP